MRDQFTMPGFTRLEGVTYETHDLECAVEIEPDEAVCLTSWYVARVFVEHVDKRKRSWVEIKNTHPLFEEISQWAQQERAEALTTLWEEYLADLPRRRRPAFDEYDEHRTHGGRL